MRKRGEHEITPGKPDKQELLDVKEAIDRDLERLFGPITEFEISIEALPGLMVKEAQKMLRAEELRERLRKIMREIERREP